MDGRDREEVVKDRVRYMAEILGHAELMASDGKRLSLSFYLSRARARTHPYVPL